MKLSKSFFVSSLLSVFLTVPASAALALDDVVAGAILGGTPFAVTNYGTNVVRGSATLVSDEAGASSTVIVNLVGLKPGTAHIGHIHGGTCAALTPGTIFHNLEPVVADSAGKGKSKTVISQGMQGLADCQWWVAYHESAENSVPQSSAIAVGPVIISDH